MEVWHSKKKFGTVEYFTTSRFSDDRGTFQRIYSARALHHSKKNDKKIKQVNYSYTKKIGTFRGFHFQEDPEPDAKTVCCVSGKILDLVLDIKKDSQTFLQYETFELDAKIPHSLVIPYGYAHAFLTMSDDCILIYTHSEHYAPQHEHSISPYQAALNTNLKERIKTISEKDRIGTVNLNLFEGVKGEV